MQAVPPAAVAAAQVPPPAGVALQRHSVSKAPALGVIYEGDSEQLGFFLAQIWNYIQEYGTEVGMEKARVRHVTMVLEGTAAEWMVSLHNDNAPQLWDYSHFRATANSSRPTGRTQGPV